MMTMTGPWKPRRKRKNLRLPLSSARSATTYSSRLKTGGRGRSIAPTAAPLWRKTGPQGGTETDQWNYPGEKSRKAPYSDYRKAKTWEQLDFFRKGKHYKLGWSLHKALELHIPIPPKYRRIASKIMEKGGQNWFKEARGGNSKW